MKLRDLSAMSVGYIGAPHTPNISVMSSCTEVEVQWSMYFPENDQTVTMINIKMGDRVIKTESVHGTNALVFDQLIDDSLYTITYSVSNCAGRREVTTDIWTCEDYEQFNTLMVHCYLYANLYLVPMPPENIHASHVINIATTSVHLVVTWTYKVTIQAFPCSIINVRSSDKCRKPCVIHTEHIIWKKPDLQSTSDFL